MFNAIIKIGMALAAVSASTAYADLPFDTAPATLEMTAVERLFDGAVEAVHQATGNHLGPDPRPDFRGQLRRG